MQFQEFGALQNTAPVMEIGLDTMCNSLHSLKRKYPDVPFISVGIGYGLVEFVAEQMFPNDINSETMD